VLEDRATLSNLTALRSVTPPDPFKLDPSIANITKNGVTDANGIKVGPIICWESAFTNLNVADVRSGAQALVIATDDAWFGTTDGPYQHAQIAQMRALETGRWLTVGSLTSFINSSSYCGSDCTGAFARMATTL